MYLYNAWYVAAWTSEFTAKPMGADAARRACGVLSRPPTDQLVALEDRCCHRGMPLSCGEVFGQQHPLRISRHGFRRRRQLRRNTRPADDPEQREGPQSFPVEERDDLVWIWMGDPAMADPDDDRPLSLA